MLKPNAEGHHLHAWYCVLRWTRLSAKACCRSASLSFAHQYPVISIAGAINTIDYRGHSHSTYSPLGIKTHRDESPARIVCIDTDRQSKCYPGYEAVSKFTITRMKDIRTLTRLGLCKATWRASHAPIELPTRTCFSVPHTLSSIAIASRSLSDNADLRRSFQLVSRQLE